MRASAAAAAAVVSDEADRNLPALAAGEHCSYDVSKRVRGGARQVRGRGRAGMFAVAVMADETVSDHEALEGFIRGDRRLGKLFYERFAPRVLRLFRCNVYELVEVEELTQEVFLQARKLRPGTVTSSVGGYLCGIASHLLYAYIRKIRKIRGRAGELDEAAESLESLVPDPEFLRAQSESDRLFMRAIRRLPFEQQVVLELSFWEDMSGSEIAEALKIPEGTVRGRIALGRKKLKRLIKELHETPQQFVSATISFASWQRNIHAYMAAIDPAWDDDDDD